MKAAIAFMWLLVEVIAFPRYDHDWENITILEEDQLLGFENRIVGGEHATPNQFPYQVGLRLLKVRDLDVYRSWCGGSLISDKVVLTAAHCLDNAASVLLYLGAHDRTKSSELKREMIQVKKESFIIHEKYDRDVIENDIGLILLPQQLELNQYINTVKLPKASQTDLVGRMAVASGWGKTADSEPGSSVLKFVNRKILDNSDCQQFFGLILKTQLCMEGRNRKATCQGDSGGPLAIEDSDGSKVIVGLTSFGGYSCEKGIPVVFTRVSSFLDWINKHTGIPVEA
uniref:limulus clotting factor C n=1 Tax=Dolopus genitalis TaxID=2488630 RepID=A0A3G5BIF4_DOLGE|nr:venom polypeptide [Dolopus genitalis]